MSTPDNHGKKAPHFAAFKPLTTAQNANDCCCDGACSSTPTLSENVSGTRYSWKVSGMDCAACARKVENAVRQLAGVNQVQVLFATEKLVVDADNDIRAQVESAVQKEGYSLRDEQAADEPQASRLKENLPLITLIVMMAVSWGLEQFNHPFGQLAFIATTLVGLYPIARQALRLIKSGSYFAIETLMSVAAIGALFIGATAEAAMVLLLFLIGERLEGWAASRARQGVSALMALKPETATRLRNGEREEVAINSLRPGDVIEVAAGGRLPADGKLLYEAATTELTAIQPGMSQSEIDQKIGRFLERTGNSAAAQNYLIAHDYRTTTPQENTAASPVQPANTLNPITNQAQTDRDNGQDTAIQDAQHAANWASMKADDAQHAIMVAQTDIDANKAAIADTRNDVSAVQSDVTNIKGDVAHAQSTADHANANANTALMNGVKLSGAVTENKNNIEQNRSDIADQQQQLDETRKTVAATGDVQTAARYQSMIDARQTAAANAQQAQADTQQQQMDDQQKQIDATQKTVSALGDAQTNAHYQEMVNAGLRAQNDANARTAAEQKQKIDTLATNQATQQHIDSVQYGEQIQRLAQDSTQTHEQIDSLTQDVTQTHQQLSNTQKRVADNSQQITTLNNHFDSLKNEVEDNRKEANAGTASAIAIASQPQVKTGDLMMVSAGAGTYNGESAVSVGTSFNAGTHTVLKAGISADTQSDFGAGVGVGYSF